MTQPTVDTSLQLPPLSTDPTKPDVWGTLVNNALNKLAGGIQTLNTWMISKWDPTTGLLRPTVIPFGTTTGTVGDGGTLDTVRTQLTQLTNAGSVGTVDSTARAAAGAAQSTANTALSTAQGAQSTASSAQSTANTTSTNLTTTNTNLTALSGRVTTLEGSTGAGTAAAALDVQFGVSPLAPGDLYRLMFDRTQTVTGMSVFLDQPAGGSAAQVVLDKLPSTSGTRLQAQSTVSLPADTARSGRNATSVTFDAGDEAIVRCVTAGSRAPTNAVVRLIGSGAALPPVKGALTAVTLSSAVASGSNVVLTGTGGSGPWDTMLVERDGEIVAALTSEQWTASTRTYTDLGAAADPSAYRLGVSHRDTVAWSNTVNYTVAVAPAAIIFSPASTPASIAGTVATSTPQVLTFTFNRAVKVGETIWVAISRTGNTTANTATAQAGTGITWDALPSAANSRLIQHSAATQVAVLMVGICTTARASGDTGSITLSGTAENSIVSVYTSTNTRGTVDQANSSSGTSTAMSVPATSTLSGQPAIAVALFTSLVKTVSGVSSAFSSTYYTPVSTSGANDRQSLVMAKTDITATTGIAASATLAASSAWVGIVAVVRGV